MDDFALEVLRISDEIRRATPAVCACGRRQAAGIIEVNWSYAENAWLCRVCFFNFKRGG